MCEEGPLVPLLFPSVAFGSILSLFSIAERGERGMQNKEIDASGPLSSAHVLRVVSSKRIGRVNRCPIEESPRSLQTSNRGIPLTTRQFHPADLLGEVPIVRPKVGHAVSHFRR